VGGAYLEKIDTSGVTAWKVQATGGQGWTSVAVRDGTTYFTYPFKDQTQLGGRTFTAPSGAGLAAGMVVAQVDAAGNVGWIDAVTSSVTIEPRAIAAGHWGVVVTGGAFGTVNLGSGD